MDYSGMYNNLSLSDKKHQVPNISENQLPKLQQRIFLEVVEHQVSDLIQIPNLQVDNLGIKLPNLQQRFHSVNNLVRNLRIEKLNIYPYFKLSFRLKLLCLMHTFQFF